MLSVATWMGLENPMLSEISQTKTNTVRYNLYVASKKKKNQMHVYAKQKQNQGQRKSRDYKREQGRDKLGVWA